MTNEELLADLKQFIEATVSQEVAGLRAELKADIARLDEGFSRLDKKLGAGPDALVEALANVENLIKALANVENLENLVNAAHLDRRITRLEQIAASIMK